MHHKRCLRPAFVSHGPLKAAPSKRRPCTLTNPTQQRHGGSSCSSPPTPARCGQCPRCPPRPRKLLTVSQSSRVLRDLPWLSRLHILWRQPAQKGARACSNSAVAVHTCNILCISVGRHWALGRYMHFCCACFWLQPIMVVAYTHLLANHHCYNLVAS